MRELQGALTSLTKGGPNAATKSLAIEYATRGVRVNAVSPGVIRTPDAPYGSRRSSDGAPPCQPDGGGDVVRAIVYLEQSQFVTGEISHVDGGQSAGR